MSHPNLEAFTQHVNVVNELFGLKTITLSSTMPKADIEEITRNLNSHISPERLHQDGEVSRAEAEKRRQFLIKAAQELRALTGDPVPLSE